MDVKDIIAKSVERDYSEFENSFNQAMQSKLETAIQNKYQDMLDNNWVEVDEH